MTPLSESHPTLWASCVPVRQNRLIEYETKFAAIIQSCTVDKAQHEEALTRLEDNSTLLKMEIEDTDNTSYPSTSEAKK